MKTLTEFPVPNLKNALKTKQDLLAAGKTVEELPAALGEALKLEGDRLTFLLASIELIGSKLEDLKRVVVFSLAENEKAPKNATKKGEHYFLVEYYPPLVKKEKREFRDGERGPRGKKKGRGFKKGRGQDRGQDRNQPHAAGPKPGGGGPGRGPGTGPTGDSTKPQGKDKKPFFRRRPSHPRKPMAEGQQKQQSQQAGATGTAPQQTQQQQSHPQPKVPQSGGEPEKS